MYEGHKIFKLGINMPSNLQIQGVGNDLAIPVNNTLMCHYLSWPLTHDHVS